MRFELKETDYRNSNYHRYFRYINILKKIDQKLVFIKKRERKIAIPAVDWVLYDTVFSHSFLKALEMWVLSTYIQMWK